MSPIARRARWPRCPAPGEAVVLFIETYVREDMIRLYGFQSALEREWFRLLMNNVQGVGAKVALAILSTLAPADLANAIALRDIAMVSPRARRRQEGGRAHRHRTEEQGAGLCRHRLGHDRPEAGARRRRGAGADHRRRLGAGQSRLFARHRRQCGGGGAEDGRRGRGSRKADPVRAEGTGAVRH